MSARILVVDDVPANVKLLEARLSAEYFDVLTASNGAEALKICSRSECDIVLLDVMMPDIDGFEVCRRLKSNPSTHFIPVVMITALDSPADRVRGLEAGADDFLTKPVSDVVLIARVRSLTRLKMMTDELRMRAVTSLEIGVQAPERNAVADTGKGGRILLVDDRASSHERLAPVLSAEHTVDVETNPAEALFHAAEGNYDLLIVSLGLENFDGLRLCSQARSLERTRQVPILAIADADNNTRLLRGLEIGVNDYLLRPVDKNELLARARTRIRGPDPQVDPRHRSGLSLRRRGIRYCDAGDRSARRGHGSRAAAALDRRRAVCDRQGYHADRSHDLDRAVDAGSEGRAHRRRAQARRQCALSRQARRPQSRGFGRGLMPRVSAGTVGDASTNRQSRKSQESKRGSRPR